MDDKNVGLYPKYIVRRIVKRVIKRYDGDMTFSSYEPVHDWVFVMNPSTDDGARFALHAYAVWAAKNGYDQLSDDIMEKLDRSPINREIFNRSDSE